MSSLLLSFLVLCVLFKVERSLNYTIHLGDKTDVWRLEKIDNVLWGNSTIKRINKKVNIFGTITIIPIISLGVYVRPGCKLLTIACETEKINEQAVKKYIEKVLKIVSIDSKRIETCKNMKLGMYMKYNEMLYDKNLAGSLINLDFGMTRGDLIGFKLCSTDLQVYVMYKTWVQVFELPLDEYVKCVIEQNFVTFK